MFFNIFPKKGYPRHVHGYFSYTSYDVGHRHVLRGKTGPSRRIFGSHYHILSGKTSFDQGHTHRYRVITGPAVDTRRGHVHRYVGIAEPAGKPLHIHRISGVTQPFKNKY